VSEKRSKKGIGESKFTLKKSKTPDPETVRQWSFKRNLIRRSGEQTESFTYKVKPVISRSFNHQSKRTVNQTVVCLVESQIS
jgi:hypothetical protein